MGLIHTAEINGIDPFYYLVALQRHHEVIADSPAAWLPWAYKDTLAQIAHGPRPRPVPPH